MVYRIYKSNLFLLRPWLEPGSSEFCSDGAFILMLNSMQSFVYFNILVLYFDHHRCATKPNEKKFSNSKRTILDDAKNSFVAGLEIRRNILLTLELDIQLQ